MNTPRVSIIIPAYKAENTIQQTIDSVIGQTFADWEIVAVNDCSPDGTGSILDHAAASDERIRVLHNEKNSGVSISRTRAIEAARGEWLALLDSDDCWHPDKLARQMELVEKYPDTGLFYTGVAFMDETGKEYDYTMSVPEKVTFAELLKENMITCSTVLVKRELLLRYPMDNDAVHEDFVAWLRILREGKPARGINEPLVTYRVSRNSRSGDKIKAAKMRWKTYSFVGVPWYQAAWSMIFYAFNGVKKYRSIKR